VLDALVRALELHVGEAWRVTTARVGDGYVVDVDGGSSVLRARGKTLEQAERRAAERLRRRASIRRADEQADNLGALLTAAIAEESRKRGKPWLRVVGSDDAVQGGGKANEPVAGEVDATVRGAAARSVAIVRAEDVVTGSSDADPEEREESARDDLVTAGIVGSEDTVVDGFVRLLGASKDEHIVQVELDRLRAVAIDERQPLGLREECAEVVRRVEEARRDRKG
jgi:hypothetical protein